MNAEVRPERLSVPAYFASDVHLRLDRPERAQRFARWIQTLQDGDTLVVVGDLCDFWFASRQQRGGAPLQCPGLRALAEFAARGGSVTILPGNHDAWLGLFYERTLGARFVHEPVDLEVGGQRVRLVHGHLLGARQPWKAVMETRWFLEAFRHLPTPVARGLGLLLDRSNDRHLAAVERRHLEVFRQYADQFAGIVDLVIFGHVHRWYNDESRPPRMVVLGSWHHRSSYLKIDLTGAWLCVEPGSPTPAPLPPSR
jgi:UDP-2,3-diacylglucosamine hydrolase